MNPYIFDSQTQNQLMSTSLYEALLCPECGEKFDTNAVHDFCKKHSHPLVADYHLNGSFPKESLTGRAYNMWRYAEVLPIVKEENRVSLGEGFTPLLPLSKLAEKYSQDKLYVKDESGNPTGSFKARGLSMAVSKAKELGVTEICIPTAGNAGSALSAYCAKAGMKAHIFMPEATPKVFQLDCEIMGAHVTRVKGNIADAAKLMKSQNDGSWFDVSTLKEPFRLEGKKTMGYEIAEQLNWKLPDVVIYPTGGGTGLIGIWKAFHEMKKMGWIDKIPTRMVAVQGTGCNPISHSFEAGIETIEAFQNPAPTIANGLRVPRPFGDKLVMKTIYKSGGTVVDISDEEIKEGLQEFAQTEGLFISPEGAAVWTAYKKLRSSLWIDQNESVVLLNTGSAYKYAENLYSLS